MGQCVCSSFSSSAQHSSSGCRVPLLTPSTPSSPVRYYLTPTYNLPNTCCQGFGLLVDAFTEQNVTQDMLPELSDNNLIELGPSIGWTLRFRRTVSTELPRGDCFADSTQLGFNTTWNIRLLLLQVLNRPSVARAVLQTALSLRD